MKILKNRGQILIIAAVLMFLISAYSLILLGSLIHSLRVNKILNAEANASWFAEAGLQKAVWCLNQTSGENCGGTFGDGYIGETDVSLDEGKFTVTLSGVDKNRDVTSVGTFRGTSTTVAAALVKAPKKILVPFEYGVFSGESGADFSSGVTVNGNLFFNSSFACLSSTVVNGDVIVSGANSINSCNINGDAKANTISNSHISGDAFYQTIINSTVDGSSYPGSSDPAPVSFPIPDQTITSWKNEAASGGTWSGNYLINEDTTLGPLKITGDLQIKPNKKLTLRGAIYVQGKIILDSRAKVALDPTYGSASAVIIADGTISFASQTQFIGTPEGGHVIFLSLASTIDPPAIAASAGSGPAILYAPYGEVQTSSGVSVIQVSAKSIDLDAGTTIIYDPSLKNTAFVADTTELFWGLVPGSRSK